MRSRPARRAIRAEVVVAACLALVPARGVAQPEDTPSDIDVRPAPDLVTPGAPAVDVERFDVAGLTDALALELGPLDVAATLRIECTTETAVVVVEAPAYSVRMERSIDLAETPSHLRGRTIALIAARMWTSIERVAGDRLDEVEDPIASIEAEHPGGPAPEVAPIAPSSLAPSSDPSILAPPSDAASRHDLELVAAVGVRIFALDAPTILGTAELGIRADWFAAAFEVGGAHVPAYLVDVDVLSCIGAVGVIPLRARAAPLEAGLGLFVEGGIVFTETTSRLVRFAGSIHLGGIVGGYARVWGSLEIDRLVGIRIALDVGYDYGVRVEAFDSLAANVNGLLVAARLGVSFWP